MLSIKLLSIDKVKLIKLNLKGISLSMFNEKYNEKIFYLKKIILINIINQYN